PRAACHNLPRGGRGGDGTRLADAPAEVKSRNDERLPVTQVLVQGDTWLLLSGCAATAEGSGLVMRTLDGKAGSAVKLLPLRSPSEPRPRRSGGLSSFG